MERVLNGTCRRVAIDSNCFIYLIEGSPYADKLTTLFQKMESKTVMGVTSTLTLTEVLTGPFKAKDEHLAEEYRAALLHFPNLKFRELDNSVAIRSAEYKAKYGLKTPDAIQLATAVVEEADAFVTNDMDFKKADFPVIFL